MPKPSCHFSSPPDLIINIFVMEAYKKGEIHQDDGGGILGYQDTGGNWGIEGDMKVLFTSAEERLTEGHQSNVSYKASRIADRTSYINSVLYCMLTLQQELASWEITQQEFSKRMHEKISDTDILNSVMMRAYLQNLDLERCGKDVDVFEADFSFPDNVLQVNNVYGIIPMSQEYCGVYFGYTLLWILPRDAIEGDMNTHHYDLSELVSGEYVLKKVDDKWHETFVYSLNLSDEVFLLDSLESSLYFEFVQDYRVLQYFIEWEWIDITSYPIDQQKRFINFLSRTDISYLEKLQEKTKKYGIKFLDCFVFIVWNSSFHQNTKEYWLYDDQEVLFSVLFSLCRSYYLCEKHEYSCSDIWNYFEYYSTQAKKSLRDTSCLSSFIKKINKTFNVGQVYSLDEFNCSSDILSISKFQWGALFKSSNLSDMLRLENYNFPELYSLDTFLLFHDNIEDTHGLVDPGWTWVLQRGLISDGNNPDVRYYIINENDSKRPIAWIKIKLLPDWGFYVWSYYVLPEYRMSGLWGCLIKMVYWDNPDIDNYCATTSLYVPSIELHLSDPDTYVSDITYEYDNDWSSGPLFELHKNTDSKQDFISKDWKRWYIINCYNNNDIQEGVIIEKIDMEQWDSRYMAIINSYFSRWFILKRVAFARSQWSVDMSSGYFVFERVLVGSIPQVA